VGFIFAILRLFGIGIFEFVIFYITMPNNSLKINRVFTKDNVHPYDEVKWLTLDAVIPGKDKPIFEQKAVEFPDFYSQNAINIIASKYFKVRNGKLESSLKDLIDRVVQTFKLWGLEQGYFDNQNEAKIFEDELTHIILHQKAWFNSPIWFNIGVEGRSNQCSACFILSVEDNMESILDWIKTEGLIFKGGSGSGINLSSLRAKAEPLSTGGSSSGVISFMKAADALAGSIKSGGSTRRAAKMVILDADHPEILDFIRVKSEEEANIRALIEAGYDLTDMNHPLWQNIFFQNANNSVRLSDKFMEAVEKNAEWKTVFRKSKKTCQTYKARDLLREIAKASWQCGDPGVQFDTTIQKWNTCKRSGRINGSNPCSEFLFLDNSSCNLASINLLKFLKSDPSRLGQAEADRTFCLNEFQQTARIIFLAQEILIDKADYPTKEIKDNSKKFRPIGLGYANLGALVMAMGLAYDSEKARAWASSITSLLTAEAYNLSSLIAKKISAFSQFDKNKKSMLEVIQMHKSETEKINQELAPPEILAEAQKTWRHVLINGEKYGFRNSQVSLLAPCGTIGLAMDCDTTGVEPEFALVKTKQLVGGGTVKYLNKTVAVALKKLDYLEEQIREIIEHLELTGNIETAPHIKTEHLEVFDTAVKPVNGARTIHLNGHVKMVAVVQPFLSGGISKTFNMPTDATIEDIYNAYFEAWRLGIKCFAVYRDGSKATQAFYSGDKKEKKLARKRLPDLRKSETHKFSILGHEGYLIYSFFEDGALGEIFIRMSKQGSTLAGLLDAFAIAISISLQYGVPLKDLVGKFIHMRFEPSGITTNSEIQFASSIIDYIFKYLAKRFLTEDELILLGLLDRETIGLQKHPKLFENRNSNGATPLTNNKELSGPPCKKCGGMTIRTGSCYSCVECGEASGGCG
jgi:ribonucleoside-diphosphate reductase alpha chain